MFTSHTRLWEEKASSAFTDFKRLKESLIIFYFDFLGRGDSEQAAVSYWEHHH